MNFRFITLVSFYLTSIIVVSAAEPTNKMAADTTMVPITTTHVTTVDLTSSSKAENKKDNLITNEPDLPLKMPENSIKNNHILVKTDNFLRIEKRQRGLLFVIQDFYITGERRSDPFIIADIDKAKRLAFDITSYENMGITGLFITWFKSGQIEQKGVFDQGFRKGLWVVWYENGQKKTAGRYKNGLREGPWTTWYENGKRMQKGIYREGKREGVWIFWYGNGKKKKAGRFSDDVKVEQWSYWDQSGKMIQDNVSPDNLSD